MGKLKVFLAVDILLSIICIQGIYLAWSKAGLNIQLRSENRHLIVHSGAQSPTGVLLQKGDVLEAVNQSPVSRIEEVEYLCERMNIGRQTKLLFSRNGQSFETDWPLTHFYSKTYLILIAVVAAIYFFLGLFVLLKARDRQEAIIFHWLSAAVAVLVVNRWGTSVAESLPWLSHLGRISYALAYAFIPVLFLNFSQIFPRKATTYLPKLVLYILAGSLALWLSVRYFLMQQTPELITFHSYLTVLNIIRIYFIIFTLASILQFILTYRRLEDESERRKLRWIFFGLLIGTLSFIILWQLPQILFSKGLIAEEWIFIISLSIPVSFAISIVRYRLLDIDLLIKRSSVYFIMISLMIVLYSCVVILAVLLAGTFTVHTSLAATAIAAVMIGLLFEPIKSRVHGYVDKKFFHIHYNFRQIQERISDRIKNSLSAAEIAAFVTEGLNKVLQPQSLIFLLRESLRGEIYAAASLNSDRLPDAKLVKLIKSNEQTTCPIITRRDLIEAGIEYEYLAESSVGSSGAVLLIPFQGQKNEIIGWLAVGGKKSGQIFTVEDIGLLKTISSQAGLAIARLELQRELLLKSTETERLQQLNEMKSYFVSSVSHELQTPLTSIKMFAEMLRTNPNLKIEQNAEYLAIIENEANRLAAMIKNILDFSKIERGILQYQLRKTDLIETLQRVINQLQFQLKAENFTVEIEHMRKKVMLFADENGLQSCFMNLISNVIKYSGQRKYLGIFTDVQKNFAVIKIQDRGIGIRAEEQAQIFETFFRSQDQRVQSSGGAGLGLHLVKHFVSAHNGKIELESVSGEGSTFTILLPL